MAKCLSHDLRERVVNMVQGGASCREAAARFSVAPSTAIRWVRDQRERGDFRAKPQGGDRRSQRIEAQAEFLLNQIEQTPDVTLHELRAKLADRGLTVGIGTIWRFFARRGISFKKKQCTLPNGIGLMFSSAVWRGSNSSRSSIRPGWCSSTKPPSRPRWRGCTAGPSAASAAAP